MATTYRTPSTMAELYDAIAAGYRIAYQAPLDSRPVHVSCKVRRDGRVRVDPPYADADPFTADAGHLGRFRILDYNA